MQNHFSEMKGECRDVVCGKEMKQEGAYNCIPTSLFATVLLFLDEDTDHEILE